jgi:hypothetical protein
LSSFFRQSTFFGTDARKQTDDKLTVVEYWRTALSDRAMSFAAKSMPLRSSLDDQRYRCCTVTDARWDWTAIERDQTREPDAKIRTQFCPRFKGGTYT